MSFVCAKDYDHGCRDDPRGQDILIDAEGAWCEDAWQEAVKSMVRDMQRAYSCGNTRKRNSKVK